MVNDKTFFSSRFKKMPLHELALWTLLIATVIGFVVVMLIRVNQSYQIRKVSRNTAAFTPIVSPLSIRSDTSGDGHFQAYRDRNGSQGTHEGIDLLVYEGQDIISPFGGIVVRYAIPYKSDTRWKGVLLRRADGLEVKIFYMTPSVGEGTMIKAGQKIGKAQSISKKYTSAMRDHVHVETWVSGKAIDPTPFIFGQQVA